MAFRLEATSICHMVISTVPPLGVAGPAPGVPSPPSSPPPPPQATSPRTRARQVRMRIVFPAVARLLSIAWASVALASTRRVARLLHAPIVLRDDLVRLFGRVVDGSEG